MNKKTNIKIIASIDKGKLEGSLLQTTPVLNVVGPLRIKVGDEYLPSPSWEDFVFIVITWWLNDIAILLKDGAVTLDFMDDDYKIRLELCSSSDDVISFSFFHDGFDEFYLKEQKVSLHSFVQELFRVSYELEKRVIDIAPNVKLRSNDFKQFKINLNKAESAWRKYKMRII